MDSERDVIHIGYPRTGTTLLQNYVFPQIQAALEEKRIHLRSDEGLSGDVFHDDIGGARRLFETNPNARVVVCIRSQRTIFPSIYSNYVKAGGNLSYGDFVTKLIRRRKFYYFDLIREYRERFGAGNLRVLLYEDLLRHRERFIGDLLDFCGLDSHRIAVAFPQAPVNPKWSDGRIRATRVINWITGFPHSIHHERIGRSKQWARRLLQEFYLVFERPATRLLGRPILAIDVRAYDQAIEDAYREQNRKLHAELGIPVDQYDYPGFGGKQAKSWKQG